MTTNPTISPELKLRDEDLEVGRPFVHPETRLEYADFHAYLCGKDPLPHWRNARIKEAHAKGSAGYQSPVWHQRWSFSSGEAWIDAIVRHYDRDGQPFVDYRTDEYGLAWAST